MSTVSKRQVNGESRVWTVAFELSFECMCWFSCVWLFVALPGSSVHRTFQGRILEWVATSFSRGFSWPRDQTCIFWVSCTGRWGLYQLSQQEALDWVLRWHKFSHWRRVDQGALELGRSSRLCRSTLKGTVITSSNNWTWIRNKTIKMCGLRGDEWYHDKVDRNITNVSSPNQCRMEISSVQFSHSVMSDSLQPHGQKHTRPPCPSPTPRVYSNSCPLSWWYHSTVSPSVIPF